MLKSILSLALLIPGAFEETFPVSGTVKLEGAAPPAKPIRDIMGDAGCSKCHLEAPLKDNLVVDAAGGVKWAFVYVKDGLGGKTFEPPAEPVLLDQVGCVYSPHLFGIMAGQPLDVRNSDPLFHNVHALPFTNKEFNQGQTRQGQVNRFKFDAPEIGVTIKCDIHPWMRSFACVVENPFYAVTDSAGKFEIKNLKAGTYTIGVWHEGLRTKDEKNEAVVVVKGPGRVEFLMKMKGP